LDTIDLSNNKDLVEIDTDTFSYLRRLSVLTLSKTAVTMLPNLGNNTNLRYLYVTDSNLKTLTSGILPKGLLRVRLDQNRLVFLNRQLSHERTTPQQTTIER